MTADEGSAEDAPGADDESSDRSAEDASGSRFDGFLDRLDEREAKRRGDHSETNGGETNAGEATENRGRGPEPDDDGARPEGDTEPVSGEDGWMWGSPRGTEPSARPSESGDPDTDRAVGSEPRPERPPGPEPAEGRSDPGRTGGSEPSDADDTRVWHEIGEPIGSEGGPPGSDSDDVEDESPPVRPEPSTGGDGEEDGEGRREGGEHTEREDSPDPKSVDRWAKLGADLRTDAAETDDDRDRARPESLQPESSPERRARTSDGPGEGSRSRGRSGAASGSGPFSPVSGNGTAELERAISAESVLVLGPTDRPLSDVICSKFLTGEEGNRDVLFVTFDDAPEERIDVCHRADGWAGGEIGIIEVGRGDRDSPAVSETTGGETGGSITVRHVSKPGNLSKLGIVITQLLAKFEETPRRTTLCFHTLSALHGQVGTKTLFRFLNTLQGRLRSSDAVGHYHMDPDLHDEIVIETLRSIFDVIVRFSADGSITVE